MHNDSLAHYGVLGMRWGVRRYQKKDGSLTSAGKKRYNNLDNATSTKHTKEKQGLTDQQKKRIKTAVAVGAAALAVGGTLYLAKTGKLSDIADKASTGKQKVLDMLKDSSFANSRVPGDAGSAPDLKNIPLTQKVSSKMSSASQAIASRNPLGSKNNCKDVSLSVAYAYNGYGDMVAGQKSFAGNLTDFMADRFENAKVNTLSADPSNAKDRITKQILKKCQDGDTGIVSVTFDPKVLRNSGTEDAHAFNFFVEGGKVLFKDGQPNPPIEDASVFFKAMNSGKEIEWTKIDDTLITKAGALEKSMSRR